MTVLASSGRDTDSIWVTNMLRHWLSIQAVRKAIQHEHLVTITGEDTHGLITLTLPLARGAFLIRRLLFHKPTLRLIAQVFASTNDCTEAQARRQLKIIRTEMKGFAHASQAGLVLPGDPTLPPLPKLHAR